VAVVTYVPATERTAVDEQATQFETPDKAGLPVDAVVLAHDQQTVPTKRYPVAQVVTVIVPFVAMVQF